jgi:hypothetical protein
MRTLNITELKKWAKDNGFKDSWWVSVNGVTIDSPIKLSEVPREGDVLLLNVSLHATDKEEWIAWRYPGYKTEAEKIEKSRKEKIRNFLTAKRILELEYAEKTQGLTRNEAIVLQDKNDLSPDNYGRFQDYLWDHYERLYTGREIYEKTIHRLQNEMFLIKQSAPKHIIESIINEATELSIPYKGLIDLVRTRYPEILYSESTQKQKTSEYEAHNGRNQKYKEEQRKKSKSGCLGLLIFSIVPSIIFLILTRD